MKFFDVKFAGVLVESTSSLDEFRAGIRIVLVDEPFIEPIGELVEELSELDIQAGLTVHARVTPALGGLFTARAGDRGQRVRFLRFNVDAVGARNLPVAGLLKDRDVARGDATAASPPVMFFEDGLVDPARSEVAGRTPPEVGQCDRFVDASFVGGPSEDFPIQLVADSRRVVQLRPQRTRLVVRVGVGAEPTLEVRDARDERDGSLASLPIDGNLEAVAVVRNIPDGEASELAGPRAGIPRDGDHSFSAGVPGRFDHGDNVIVPVEHVGGVRRGLVVSSGPGGDPLDSLRDVVTLGDVLGEHAEGDAIIPVRLLVVVLLVNPADDGLGRVAIVESVGQTADLLADTDAPPQQVFVAVVAVPGGKQEHRVRELNERVGVAGRETFSGVDPLSEGVNSVVGVHCHADNPLNRWNVNPRCESPTEHYPDGLITGGNRQTAAASGGAAA